MNSVKSKYIIPVLPVLGFITSDCTMAHSEIITPNIVFIFADDMGYGDVSALNPTARTTTPAIDAMVNEGITFSNAHASASVSTPSRYGLLTGRYAFRSERAAYGIWGFDEPVIESGRETLASLLKKAGYTTACIGKWHLGLGWQTKDGEQKAVLDKTTGLSNVNYGKEVFNGPNDYGFDYSFIHPASLDIPPYLFLRNHKPIDPDIILTTDYYPDRKKDTHYAWDRKHTDSLDVYWEKGVWWRRGEMSRSFRIEDCHTTIVNEGVKFIQRQIDENPDNPFFLYLPLTAPHTPWMPTESFRGKSPIGAYGDFILDVDDAVKQIRKTLESYGIDKNTILVFASDNGAYWPSEEINLRQHDSNHGRRGQKGDVWEGGHHIPLVITWPEYIQQPVVYDQLVSLTDFFSTFCELIGSKKGSDRREDSYSFLHVLKGELNKPVRPYMIHHSSRNMYGIREGEWKYIDGLGSGGFTEPAILQPEPGLATGQLYNLTTDPQETNNCYFEFPEEVKRLKKMLIDNIEGSIY